MTNFYRRFGLVALALLLLGVNSPVFAAGTNWDSVKATLLSSGVSVATSSSIISLARQRNITPDQAQQWADTISSVNQAKIPVSLFTDRLTQGLSKSIPPTKIQEALFTLEKNVQWGKSLLSPYFGQTDPENAGYVKSLKDIDAALRAGMSRSDLQKTLSTPNLSRAKVSILISMAANLYSLGLAPTDARDLLLGASRSSVSPSQLDTLQNAFIQGYAAGQPQNKLLTEFRSALSLQEDPVMNNMNGNGEMKKEIQQEFHRPGGNQGMTSLPDMGGSRQFSQPVGGGGGGGGGGWGR